MKGCKRRYVIRNGSLWSLALCVFAIVLGAPCLSVVGFAATTDWRSIDDFGKWVTYYYLNPEPEKIPIALLYFSESPVFFSNVQVPMAAFFGALFRKDGVLMNNSFDYIEKEGGANARILMMQALHLAFTSESRTLLVKARASWLSEKTRGGLENLLSGLPTEYLSVRTSNDKLALQDEDSLWAAFSATGAQEPIRKMISLIHLEKEGQGTERMIGRAAIWSLSSNAGMHKRVLEICKEELADTTGTTQSVLQEIIQSVERDK